MLDTEQLKAELEDIHRALQILKEGSLAFKILTEQKAGVEAQLIGNGAVAQGQDVNFPRKNGYQLR